MYYAFNDKLTMYLSSIYIYKNYVKSFVKLEDYGKSWFSVKFLISFA